MNQINKMVVLNYPLNKKIKIKKDNIDLWAKECGNNNVFILEEFQGKINTIWEYSVIEFFMKKLENKLDATILDIGAQQGLYTLLAKFYPKTKWYSFEPFKFSYDLLNSNLIYEDISNVSTYNIALSNKIGEDTLYVPIGANGERGGLNALAKITNGRINLKNCDKIKIKTDTIDNLFLDKKIDFIKMDTEGFEYYILLGGFETIKKYKPCILTEYMIGNMKTCGVNQNQFDNFFKNLNYKFIELDFGERFYYPINIIYNFKYCKDYFLVKNNLYFTHISKTGGTFLLREFMQPIFGSNLKGDTLNNTKDKIGFSIIRNPYDWYISMYYYAKNQNFKNLGYIQNINITLQEFSNILIDPFNNIDITFLKNHSWDPFHTYLVYVLENCKTNCFGRSKIVCSTNGLTIVFKL